MTQSMENITHVQVDPRNYLTKFDFYMSIYGIYTYMCVRTVEKDLNIRGLSLDMASKAAAGRARWRTLTVASSTRRRRGLVSDICVCVFCVYHYSIY